MAYPREHEMVWIGDRRWWFLGARITPASEFEWRNNCVYLLEADGSASEVSILSDLFPLRPSIRYRGAVRTPMPEVHNGFKRYFVGETAGCLLGMPPQLLKTRKICCSRKLSALWRRATASPQSSRRPGSLLRSECT